MEAIYSKIRYDGNIVIPRRILELFGLKGGDEVEVQMAEHGILLTPKKSIVDDLSGSMKVKQHIVDEVIEHEELYQL